MSELMATQCRQRAEGVLVLVEVNGRWLWMCVRACVVVDVVVDAGEYKGSGIVMFVCLFDNFNASKNNK